jgi:hypothetical protein
MIVSEPSNAWLVLLHSQGLCTGQLARKSEYIMMILPIHGGCHCASSVHLHDGAVGAGGGSALLQLYSDCGFSHM